MDTASDLNWIDAVEFFRTEHFTKLTEQLKKMVQDGKVILPERKHVFRAFQETPFSEVKVVILGQDPYPNQEHACGLAFAVPVGTKPLPPSLMNIFKELDNDIGSHCNTLEQWSSQGVLLLNTSLTVEQGKPNSHSNLGWNKLTTQVIRALSDLRENIVFILWGANAQKYVQLIDSNKHCIIMSAHPSPLSAYRGFFGSKPFSKTNEYLVSKQLMPIQW